jgi:hypothetical protein
MSVQSEWQGHRGTLDEFLLAAIAEAVRVKDWEVTQRLATTWLSYRGRCVSKSSGAQLIYLPNLAKLGGRPASEMHR